MAINLDGITYVQDFDTLANTGTSKILPLGWFLFETGTNANDTYAANNGSSTTGNTYSYGATGDSDRAFGGLQSNALNPTVGASFINATEATITGFNISYFGEQWRLGALGREDRLDFQYSLDATTLSTGFWIDFKALNFVAPVTAGTVGALDGNAATNRRAISSTLDGLTVAPGETVWIRWSDFNPTGSDDGLAVDDFTLVPLLTQTGVGNMQITEFMYQGANGEFVEFTNVGTAPVDMTGWSFDDDSRTPGSFDLSAFGIVQPGESVILTEATAEAFRAAWGLDASFKVIGSLSGGNNLGRNDEINLYDAAGNQVDRLTYGDSVNAPGTIRTQGTSGWTTVDNLEAQLINSDWVFSEVNNVQNARTSAGGDIASPGIFNTPTTFGVKLIETGGATQVAEGGASDTYTLVLRSQPTADVVITLDPGTQLTTDRATVTFTQANWNISQIITVTAVDDDIAEGDHTGTVAHSVASADANFDGLGLRAVTASIADNDAPPASTVSIVATDANAAESGTVVNTGTFTLTRAGDMTADLTVTYTVGGTATNGIDYNRLSGSIVIPAGEAAATITITPVNDANPNEGSETVMLTLVPTAAYGLGPSNSSATVTIEDNTTGSLKQVGTITSANGAEISAFDPGSNRLYVVAGDRIEIFSLSNTGALSLVGNLPLGFSTPAGTTVLPNSVAVNDGIVAAAYAIVNTATGAQQKGQVSFYEATTGAFLNAVEVGYLPDMVVFSPDGTRVLTADEGEPNSYGQPNSFDPEGSVSIIDISNGVANATVQTAGFTAFNDQATALRAAGVRIFGPGATVAQDLEPEYITFSGDGTLAYVALQENNALAVVDIASATVTQIIPLGYKDHSLPGNGLDASDRDSGINIQNWPVFGMYQPDAIASYTVNGQTYIITANEGDARDYTGFSEEVRVGAGSYVLDPTVFPNAASLKQQANLGRLTVTNATGDTDGDGDFDRIEVFGSRSFSIWDSSGNRVFDSGDELERITAAQVPSIFNSNGGFIDNTFDTRSDNKGPEPEGVVVGVVNGRTYAFIGLERTGDVVVYDVTNPVSPTFIEYINVPGDQGIEGLTFVSASDSPTGVPLLITANEVSRTVSVFEFTPPPPPTPTVAIYDIQGESHISPFNGQQVITSGIVTAIDTMGGRGFYLQDPTGDGKIATSDAIFVFTNAAPTVRVGDAVRVEGLVSEFIPGGVASRNLSITQITGPTVNVLSSGNALPAATLIGAGGRVPPTETIDDDAFTVFDPVNDGIDFFESLEAMLVKIQNFQVIDATNRFGEIFGVIDNGFGATGLSDRGALTISPGDFNPERIQIQADSGVTPFPFPNVSVGDRLGNVTGVVSYAFGNYEVVVTEDFRSQIVPGGLQPEVSTLTRGGEQLLVATYNVLNLDPNDSDGDRDIADGRFDAIARHIVTNLNRPDIIALQEVQDNSGSANNGVTAADVTLQTLINAIVAAGGPTYAFIDTPGIIDGAGGGQPGGNIRNAYLYDPSRVSLVAGSVSTIGSQAPGEAFASARLPLIASFEFNGETVTLVNNHFSSKGGSAPIMGVEQPFDARQEDPTVNNSVDRRRQQSAMVQDYVSGLLGADPDANVVVLGDFNEFQFVSPVSNLVTNTGLTNLTETLPDNERYTFIFQGNAQAIDHILVTGGLATGAEVDIVHTNIEFLDTPQRASDHDPVLARLTLAPTFNIITGTNRRDVLVGTDGRDRIFASPGRDIITTGGGRDQIVYTNPNQRGDTITDFEVGADQLVFTDLLASIGYRGINPLADGTIQIRSQGNNGVTQLSLELDRMGGSRTNLTNFITFQGVDAAALNNADNFVF